MRLQMIVKACMNPQNLINYLGGSNFDLILETSRNYQRVKSTDNYEAVSLNPPERGINMTLTPDKTFVESKQTK